MDNNDRFDLPPVNITWIDNSNDFYYEREFGPFRVGPKLAAGNYGMVKVGEDRENHRQVAIKLLDKNSLPQIARVSVKTEAAVMSFLSHKNIVGLYAVFENRNHVCMVMEYAGGGELYDYINRRTKMQEAEARKLFVQLLSGIGYAHSKHIIHRDIKAENVFLDEKLETIKIGDWGFASVHHPGEPNNESPCGTLHYAAPEILCKEPAGPEADIWALGVLVYFMVCGWLPYRGRSHFDIFYKIKKGEYHVLPGHVSAEFRDLIQKIFTVNRFQRPTIATITSHPWCLLSQSDPEYLKRPKLPRLLQLQIKHFQFKKDGISPPGEFLYTDSTPTATPRGIGIGIGIGIGGGSAVGTTATVTVTAATHTEPAVKRMGKENDKTKKTSRPKREGDRNIKTANTTRKTTKPSSSTSTSLSISIPSTSTSSKSKEQAQKKAKAKAKVKPKTAGRRPTKYLISEEEEDEMKEQPLLYEKPEPLPDCPEYPPMLTNRALEVPPGWFKPLQTEPPESAPISSIFCDETTTASHNSPEVRRGRRASVTLPHTPAVPSLTASLSPRTSSPSKLRPAMLSSSSGPPSRKLLPPSPSPLKTKQRKTQVRNSRPAISNKISSFSVLRVNSDGLKNLKTLKEVQLLSVERTKDNQEEEYVVLVTATADRGQETRLLDLLKGFESGASKLKKSKSVEDISRQSLFQSTGGAGGVGGGEFPSPDPTRTPPKSLAKQRAKTPQFRRRGFTWDANDFNKFKASQQQGGAPDSPNTLTATETPSTRANRGVSMDFRHKHFKVASHSSQEPQTSSDSDESPEHALISTTKLNERTALSPKRLRPGNRVRIMVSTSPGLRRSNEDQRDKESQQDIEVFPTDGIN